MDSLVYTIEENCIGCNKCILSCPVDDANISYIEDGDNKIHLDPERCIMCGKCLEICDHEARDFRDDLELFFDELKRGKDISLIFAPSFKSNFNEYKRYLGYFKKLGVNNIFDVSFGADITTWCYVRLLEAKKMGSTIAQPCPAIVNYIQKYKHDLLSNLAEIQSPMMCAAVYIKKYLNIDDTLAFISPCISKAMEIKDPNTANIVNFNVTYKKLSDYFDSIELDLAQYPEVEFDRPAIGLGNIFSQPGGLKENVHIYDDNIWVKQIEGVKHVYDYLEEYSKRKKEGQSLPEIVDALSCFHGCNVGSATCKEIQITDIDEVMNNLKVEGSRSDKPIIEDLMEAFNEKLKLEDFKREYTKEESPLFDEPSTEDYDQIFNKMYKFTEESRNRDCNSCGYRSCHHMAKAVYNEINHIENCIEYNQEQIEKLKELDRIKTDLISTVSHELRTPLTSVLGFSNIIKKKLENVIFPQIETSDRKINRSIRQVRSNVNIIVDEGTRLTELINDVLDIAKMESGKLEWEKEDINIVEIVKQAAASTSSLIDEKRLELIMDVDEDIPVLTGDKDRFVQVVINLLSNAVKFTEKGSITCKVMLKERAVVVSIIDTGVGISNEDINQVFERFKQAGDTLTNKPKGTGLGLPICKQIVEHHGGEIWVESKPGEGSNFSFSIPVNVKEKKEESDDSQVSEKNIIKQLKDKITTLPAKNNKKQVLVVDDDQNIRDLLYQELIEEGFTVIEAADGIKAIKKIKESKPDIIILDIMMPGMNGLDVAAVIKNDPEFKDIPVLILSIVDDNQRGMHLGIDKYMKKPFEIENLLTEIERLLSEKKTGSKFLAVDEEGDVLDSIDAILKQQNFKLADKYNYQEYLTDIKKNNQDLIFINSDFPEEHQIIQALKYQKDTEEFFVIIYNSSK